MITTEVDNYSCRMASTENTPGTSGDAVETKDDKPTASNQEDPAVDLEVQPNLPHQSATNTAGLAAAAAEDGEAETKPDAASDVSIEAAPLCEMATFKVIFNKHKYVITFDLHRTVDDLKKHLEAETKVPASMQKLMFKGLMKDGATLREHGVQADSRVMMVGSTVNDIISVSVPDPKAMKELESEAASCSKTPLCTQKPHKTVLDKYGKPEDLAVGVRNKKQPLPHTPLSGMYNKSGGKVRLTFKLEEDQLWIGTKERTEKVQMGSIKAVVSEPLVDHEEYHMLALQLGPTEASRYWIYWVPAQYTDAIKDAILGNWQFF